VNYIGDSPSDAVAAKNAGMPAIAVLWGSHSEENLRKAPFDHFCQTVEELKLLLPKTAEAT
jgi:phosphoglycolate phosphatase-like HAD superfamily hydrolase